ncbi:MAG: hypothetical protein KA941_01605 [Flavobacteriales bacterium]|nr:hypothetical protein [Flavobacteriales bacterium]
MKHFVTLLLNLTVIAGLAQCTFTPTISPNSVILCPNSSEVLTTEVCDSYQWYKDGSPIPGATQQTHSVSYFEDGGSSFSVEATLNGCTEMSGSVLVDGWVFLLPFVMHAGDEPFSVGPNGSTYCEGDTALLILMPPYDTNIQWTNDGVPIPGATDDTLVVTTPGNYHVTGAPSLCPDFVQQLGVILSVDFWPAFQPTIIEIGDMLCIYPNDFTWHQWYLDGEPLSGGECITPVVAGSYTVSATYLKNCGPGISEPYDFFLGIADRTTTTQLFVRPNPANTECTITSSLPIQGPWTLTDMAGREVRQGRFNGCTQCSMELGEVEGGNYLLTVSDRSVRIAVVR